MRYVVEGTITWIFSFDARTGAADELKISISPTTEYSTKFANEPYIIFHKPASPTSPQLRLATTEFRVLNSSDSLKNVLLTIRPEQKIKLNVGCMTSDEFSIEGIEH